MNNNVTIELLKSSTSSLLGVSINDTVITQSNLGTCVTKEEWHTTWDSVLNAVPKNVIKEYLERIGG